MYRTLIAIAGVVTVAWHGQTDTTADRPCVRRRAGGEGTLPSWEAALSEDLLAKWALNLMLIKRFDAKVRPRRPPAGG